MRRAARALAATSVFLGIVTARVLVESRSELDLARAAAARDDVDGAIDHLRLAAAWYAPGNPHSEAALAQLAALARAAEAEEKPALALRAWRAIRSATGSATSLYVPHRARAVDAQQHIARLMAHDAPEIDGAMTEEERAEVYERALRDARPPSPAAMLAAWFGLTLFCIGLVVFAMRAFSPDDRLLRPAAVRWGGVSAVGFALLVLGLGFA